MSISSKITTELKKIQYHNGFREKTCSIPSNFNFSKNSGYNGNKNILSSPTNSKDISKHSFMTDNQNSLLSSPTLNQKKIFENKSIGKLISLNDKITSFKNLQGGLTSRSKPSVVSIKSAIGSYSKDIKDVNNISFMSHKDELIRLFFSAENDNKFQKRLEASNFERIEMQKLLKTIEEKNKDLEKKLLNLQGKLSEGQIQMMNSQKILSEAEKNITELKNRLESVNQEKINWENYKKSLLEEVNHMNTLVDMLKGENNKLLSEKSVIECLNIKHLSKIDQLALENEHLKKKHDFLLKDKQSVESDLESLKTEFTENKSIWSVQYKEISVQLENIQRENELLHKNHEKATESIKFSYMQLEDQHKLRMGELEEAYNYLNEENLRLKDDLKNLENKQILHSNLRYSKTNKLWQEFTSDFGNKENNINKTMNDPTPTYFSKNKSNLKDETIGLLSEKMKKSNSFSNIIENSIRVESEIVENKRKWAILQKNLKATDEIYKQEILSAKIRETEKKLAILQEELSKLKEIEQQYLTFNHNNPYES